MEVFMKSSWGLPMERIAAALTTILTGIILIWLAVEGPLIRGVLTYKTAPTAVYQIMGQDLVNLMLLGPLAVLTSILLFLKKNLARYLLLSFPLYIIYFVLTYTVGLEWSSPLYSGNSEQYFYPFLFLLASSVGLLIYGLSIFPKNLQGTFPKVGLRVYSALYGIFMLMFALMWLGEVNQVLQEGTTRAYGEVPTGFWMIRYFDLGFTIPLGLLSVYLLWTRPDSSGPLQFLFYGFFLTMITAVNSMGIMMYLKGDPHFLLRDMALFGGLFFLVFGGFLYVVRHYRLKE